MSVPQIVKKQDMNKISSKTERKGFIGLAEESSVQHINDEYINDADDFDEVDVPHHKQRANGPQFNNDEIEDDYEF